MYKLEYLFPNLGLNLAFFFCLFVDPTKAISWNFSSFFPVGMWGASRNCQVHYFYLPSQQEWPWGKRDEQVPYQQQNVHSVCTFYVCVLVMADISPPGVLPFHRERTMGATSQLTLVVREKWSLMFTPFRCPLCRGIRELTWLFDHTID